MEQLWQGTMEAPIIKIRKSKTYRLLAEDHLATVATLRNYLSEELQAKLDEVLVSHDALSSYCEQQAFTCGVRFGMQILKEAEVQKDDPKK